MYSHLNPKRMHTCGDAPRWPEVCENVRKFGNSFILAGTQAGRHGAPSIRKPARIPWPLVVCVRVSVFMCDNGLRGRERKWNLDVARGRATRIAAAAVARRANGRERGPTQRSHTKPVPARPCHARVPRVHHEGANEFCIIPPTSLCAPSASYMKTSSQSTTVILGH
eukprot:3206282-Prymnesium_polylepis.1